MTKVDLLVQHESNDMGVRLKIIITSKHRTKPNCASVCVPLQVYSSLLVEEKLVEAGCPLLIDKAQRGHKSTKERTHVIIYEEEEEEEEAPPLAVSCSGSVFCSAQSLSLVFLKTESLVNGKNEVNLAV
ncbi:hypothetical protein SAY86_011893 [Trapa natans]|uniref:Uncharacterized protein n=1 Tax=Trapa natans TaxID=22666 RepID=A0AAN7LX77_TRANT|nr:hypothetical protein SAY86_011893 [Trapa natans]